MGHSDALKDGIRFSKGEANCDWYYPHCHMCGAEVPSWNYHSMTKYTCKACKIKIALADKESAEEECAEAKEKKLVVAIERITKITKISKYEKAIKTVRANLHKPGWFQSTEEIMVALELLKSGVSTRHQVKLGSYRADFVLPDLKVVLEADGHMFHNEFTKEREELRDGLIVAALGAEWEVIRIQDTFINQKITQLVKAIETIRAERKKVRAQHNGALPDWYIDRRLA